LLASLFGIQPYESPHSFERFAVLHEEFLEDCEPEVLASYRQSIEELKSLGLTPTIINASRWHDSREIFAPIQASEAAKIHAGHFAHFEPSIRERLAWGASLRDEELASLRQRHVEFRSRMDALLDEHQLLLMPCAPVTKLEAGADHSQTRARLLRYTTPVSLAGMPVVTLPYLRNGQPAGGMQLVAARQADARLVALAARLGEDRRCATL
jgi:Asp-tRNA(Asn)/Glu-tRNA(Gln) amidotransferase A subunit family amidase